MCVVCVCACESVCECVCVHSQPTLLTVLLRGLPCADCWLPCFPAIRLAHVEPPGR